MTASGDLNSGFTHTPPSPPPDMANDTPFGESYELIRELGRGGMAVVYLMRERSTGAERAVKVVQTRFADDEEAVARFDREARLVAQLQHPNIVATHSVRWIESVGFGLVMDHIHGCTLKEILRDGPALSFDQATRILDDIASALSYAHEHAIVHRDVKPENIFIDEASGRALLADFGIARSAQSETQLTMAGVAIGTPTYMAPEQIDGGAVDARSDLYSLGLVGWEMLTGRRPWDGETLYNVIYHQKHDQLAAIDALRPGTPLRLTCAIEGLLEKSPADRWQSAADFRERLASSSAPPVRRNRQNVEPAPDATIAIQVPTARRERNHARIRGVAPGIVVIATLVSAALLFAWPVSNWHPFGPVDRAVPEPAPHTQPTSHTVLHSPIAGYGAANGAANSAANSPANAADAYTTPAGGTTARPVDSLGGIAVTDPATDASTRNGVRDSATASDISADAISAAEHEAPDSTSQQQTAQQAAQQSSPDMPSQMPPILPQQQVVSVAAPLAAAAAAHHSRFAVSTGGAHTCLISAVGTYCWGANGAGQLGTGVDLTTATPTAIAGTSHFTTVATGLSHTCALDDRGSAFCWGNNQHGQLGNGTRQSTDAPSRVALARTLVSIVSGSAFSCGISGDGQIYCWGADDAGQLGDGALTDRTTPVKVFTSMRFAKLAAGWHHACALDDAGRAYCWGANDSGQLGDGTVINRATPIPVSTDLRFAELSAGSGHTCGVTTGGSIYCWGDNQYGQIGDGSSVSHLSPFAARSTQHFQSVSAGSVHTCAVTRTHEAWCWGRNTYGQLGDGTTSNRPTPVKVSGGHDFTSVSSFGSHTCGTTTSDELFCWGYNLDGQLGDGTREHRLRPTYVEKPTG